MRDLVRLLAALAPAVLLLASCGGAAEPPPPPPGAIPAGQSIGSSGISGRVVFEGSVPPPAVISMTSDAACVAAAGTQARDDIAVGRDGGLKNVFVYVSSGLGGKIFAAPSTPVVLDQRGCTYHPRVFGIQVGQVLEIVNSDPTLHNIHSMPAGNKPFNVGMPTQGMRIRRWFERPEVMVRVKCDLHNWMTAWVGVVDNPFYAVTDESGGYSISGLPAGEYDLEAWHEAFGVQRAKVTLGDAERKEIGFKFESR